MGVSIKLAPDCVGVSVNQSRKPLAPLIQEILGRNMADNMHQLPLALRLLEFILQPFQHVAWVSGVSQQKKVHIILSLSIQGDDLQVIELGQLDTEKSSGSQHIVGLLVEPLLPGLGQTPIQHRLAVSLVVVDIDRETLMIPHGRKHSDFGVFFESL